MKACLRILCAVATIITFLTAADGALASHATALPAGGVVSHLSYFNTPYADARSAGLGVKVLEAKMVRDSIPPNQPQGYYDRLYDAFRSVSTQSGARFLLTTTRADESVTAQLDAIAPLVASGIVWGVEGANEWDNVTDLAAGWEAQLRAHQKELYLQVKARWPGLPVVGPSLSFSKTGPIVGDLSSYLDYGNIHYYGSIRGIDTRDLDRRIANARAVSGSKPMWATEANGIVGTGYPDSERAQATVMRDLYWLLGQRGVRRVFSYELVNGSRPSRPASDRENNFGSFKVSSAGTWQAKPVFFEVRAANRRG